MKIKRLIKSSISLTLIFGLCFQMVLTGKAYTLVSNRSSSSQSSAQTGSTSLNDSTSNTSGQSDSGSTNSTTGTTSPILTLGGTSSQSVTVTNTTSTDTTSPTMSFSPNSFYSNTSRAVTLTPSDTGGSGMMKYQYRINVNGTIGSWTSWITGSGSTNATISGTPAT